MVLTPYLFGINSEEWELKKEKNNIKVYLRDKDSFTKEYLAETIINSDLNTIYNIQSNITITKNDISYIQNNIYFEFNIKNCLVFD